MKIAIAGSGKIVPTFTDAASKVSDIEICAIYCREKSIDKGRKIAEECNFTKVYTDYDKMLQDNEIEFIYIALPNSLHFEFAKKALESGKNVICEKPFTLCKDEAQKLMDIAVSKKLFIFEAITTIHMPNYKLIKENLKKIAPIKIVSCNFTQYSSRYDNYLKKIVAPAFDPECGGGALTDLNIYNIHFVCGLFGRPQDIIYLANHGFNGVDTSGITLMKYDGFSGTLIAAKDSCGENISYIEGEKGYIKMIGNPNRVDKIEIHIKDNESKEYNLQTSTNRMTYELEEFNNIYKNKDYEALKELMQHTLNVVEVYEKAAASNKKSDC